MPECNFMWDIWVFLEYGGWFIFLHHLFKCNMQYCVYVELSQCFFPFNTFIKSKQRNGIWQGLLIHHVSCVITNCDQHQWVIPSSLSIALWALVEENITWISLFLSLYLFLKILLFQLDFLILFSITMFSPYFPLVELLLQHVALFHWDMGSSVSSEADLYITPFVS